MTSRGSSQPTTTREFAVKLPSAIECWFGWFYVRELIMEQEREVAFLMFGYSEIMNPYSRVKSRSTIGWRIVVREGGQHTLCAK